MQHEARQRKKMQVSTSRDVETALYVVMKLMSRCRIGVGIRLRYESKR